MLYRQVSVIYPYQVMMISELKQRLYNLYLRHLQEAVNSSRVQKHPLVSLLPVFTLSFSTIACIDCADFRKYSRTCTYVGLHVLAGYIFLLRISQIHLSTHTDIYILQLYLVTSIKLVLGKVTCEIITPTIKFELTFCSTIRHVFPVNSADCQFLLHQGAFIREDVQMNPRVHPLSCHISK